MSDTAAAVLILPFLATLVLLLECSRLGCSRLLRHTQKAPTGRAGPPSDASQHASAL